MSAARGLKRRLKAHLIKRAKCEAKGHVPTRYLTDDHVIVKLCSRCKGSI